MAINPGDAADADEVINAIGANFNDTAQMIFNADYIGFDSRLTNSTTPSLKNVKYSTFTSDDADTIYGFLYDSSNDLYKAPDLSDDEYVIIEADDASVLWSANDTRLVKVASGKWLIYGTTGSAAVKRAQIMKSLFFGTSGTNQLILDFTNVTAVKTRNANDVGKRGHFATGTRSASGAGTYTGTFADTSTNNNCSSWSKCGTNDSGSGTSQWEIPSGTIKNSAGPASTSDELGTDLSADELNNPADCQIQCDGSVGNASRATAIVLCKGDIVWVDVGMLTSSDIDFFTTHSIPDMTAADTPANEGVDTMTLIFKDTVTSTNNAIAVINSQIDGTSSEQISISANGGSNYTDVNNAEIARPIAGTALWRRIVITRTDLSKEDKVTEQACKFEFY